MNAAIDDQLMMFKLAGTRTAAVAIIRRRDTLLKTSAATAVILKHGSAEEKRLVKEAWLPILTAGAGLVAGGTYGYTRNWDKNLGFWNRMKQARKPALVGAGIGFGAGLVAPVAGKALGWAAQMAPSMLMGGRGAGGRQPMGAAQSMRPPMPQMQQPAYGQAPQSMAMSAPMKMPGMK